MLNIKNDIPLLTEEIQNAKSIDAACEFINAFLNKLDIHLLSMKFADSLGEHAAVRPFSNYSKNIVRIARDLRQQGNCAFAKESNTRLQPFELDSIDKTKYSTVLDKEFFAALETDGLANIAVVPIMIRRATAMFTMDLRDNQFDHKMKSFLGDLFESITTEFIGMYPNISMIFEQTHLTEMEGQIVAMKCLGFSNDKIQKEIQLSELTIRCLLQNAAHKMGASCTEHLIYKALKFDELSPYLHDQKAAGKIHQLH